MPNNTQKVVLEINPSQAQMTANQKLFDAVKGMGGGAQAGGAQVSGTFSSPEALQSFMKQSNEYAKEMNMKLGKMNVTQTEGGDFKATADVQKKAFSTGGMVAGLATVVGGIGAGFTKLIGLSQVFSTFMSTTGKILGTAVDLMLAPLMPIFLKIMVWLIQTVFPIATKLGNWLGGVVGDIGGGAAVAGLAAGWVGLKVAPTVLSKLGEKLGGALAEKFGYDNFGELIAGGIDNAKETLSSWADTVGSKISSGIAKATSTLSDWYTSVATGISSAFSSVTSTLSSWYTTVATGVSNAFNTVTDTLSTWYTSIATGVSSAFSAVADTLSTWYDTVAKGVTSAISTVGEIASSWYETVAKGVTGAISSVGEIASSWYETVAKGVTGAISSVATIAGEWYNTVAKGITNAIGTVGEIASEWYNTVAKGITNAIGTIGEIAQGWYDTIATGINSAISTAGAIAQDWYDTIATGISTAISTTADTLKTWGTTIGGYVQSGIQGAQGALSGAWKAIGGFIGTAMQGLATAWTKIGNAIGGALSGAGRWAKMGGMIGAGLGVVAIGAAIGYSMWKTYKKYEEGKDITAGLDKTETLQMMQERYGMTQLQSRRMIEGMEAGGVSTSAEGFGNLVDTFSMLATEFEMWGTMSADRLASLSVKEQKILAEMLKEGELGGDPSRWTGGWEQAIKILTHELTGYQTPFSEQGLVKGIRTTAGIQTQAELSKEMGGGFTGAVLASQITWEQQNQMAKMQDRNMREQLNELFGTEDWTQRTGLFGLGGYKQEMTPEMSKLGFLTGAAEGDAQMRFLEQSPELQNALGGTGVYQREEVEGLAGGVAINFVINGQTTTLNAGQLEKIIELLETADSFNGAAITIGP